VSLLTHVHGSKALVYDNSVFHVFINVSKSEQYYVTTDSKWETLVCEEGDCKVEKCVTISTPPGLFPSYKLPAGRQCSAKVLKDADVYTLSLCNKSQEREAKFEFKRRNEYAKLLSEKRKKEMQQRLIEIGMSLLLLNILIITFSLFCKFRASQGSSL
jgi:hypothetical protein